jgi:hypothetical protein
VKDIIDSWKNYTNLLQESSLSRVHQHVMEHECAIVSAYRKDPGDTSKCADVEQAATPEPDLEKTTEPALQINRMKSADLKAYLLSQGYGVTEVVGSYIENFSQPTAVEVKEKSLFVVNLKNTDAFKSDIENMGKKFCQDSVMFIPQGGKGAYLVGTNNSEFPGLANSVPVGDLKMGKESEFMTRVGDRPFTTTEGKLETYSSLSRLERMAVKAMAKRLIEG